MKLRTRRRKPEASIEDLLPRFHEDGHRVVPEADWREVGHLQLERWETWELVRGCIDRLPESYRTVLVLRDMEELDTEATAKLLELSEDAVKSRLHRARQALRTLLVPYFQESPT